jgi:hypothetical protein
MFSLESADPIAGGQLPIIASVYASVPAPRAIASIGARVEPSPAIVRCRRWWWWNLQRNIRQGRYPNRWRGARYAGLPRYLGVLDAVSLRLGVRLWIRASLQATVSNCRDIILLADALCNRRLDLKDCDGTE